MAMLRFRELPTTTAIQHLLQNVNIQKPTKFAANLL
jgi:hypothetical protein